MKPTGFFTRAMAEFMVPMMNPAGPESAGLPASLGGGGGGGTGPVEEGASWKERTDATLSGADLGSEPVSGNVNVTRALSSLFKPKPLGNPCVLHSRQATMRNREAI